MAKKKTPAKKAKPTAKAPAKKLAAKPAARPVPKKPARAAKAAPSKAAPIKAAPRPVATPKPATYLSLGRPRVTADEPLYLLFKDDHHARSVFEFLRVQTVHDLEQFAAQDIISRLTRPIHESVERIRQKLAEKNRYLAGDEQYLAKHRKHALAIAEKE